MIHADLNPANILIDSALFKESGEVKVLGIIDFGDSTHSPTPRVHDAAIFLSYCLLADPLNYPTTLISAFRGWQSTHPLSASEISSLQLYMKERAVISILLNLVESKNK